MCEASKRLEGRRWMKEKGNDGAEKGGMISDGEKLRERMDVEEDWKKRCLESTLRGLGRRRS